MAGFDGLTVPDDIASLLRDEQLAGVILFRRNIKSVQQLAALTAELKAIAARPILIAVDHEGGRVFRMPDPFTRIPPMATVGRYVAKHPGSDMAYQLGRLMGQELAAVGINVDFAPVLDINTNPDNPIIGDRAFGNDPKSVAALGCQMIRGLHDGGVFSCGKHFPGHGDTDVDSHLGLPSIAHTWERLHLFELAPFKAAIAAGVPMLMTGHILCGVIDGELPVTLSKRAITMLLRDELGYDGVVVTDDLQMGAIAKRWSTEEAAVRSLAAGCDLALICKDPPTTQRAIQRVRQAVADGELKEAALAVSAGRIGRLLDRTATLSPAPSLAAVGSASHQNLVKSML